MCGNKNQISSKHRTAQSDRECLQVWEVERQVECATGNKRKYGFGSECAVLCGNIGSKWTP